MVTKRPAKTRTTTPKKARRSATAAPSPIAEPQSKHEVSRKGPKSRSVSNSFTPTLGDLDLHLFGEGKHLRIYDKLGAHPITHERKRGVAFAVWAPAADRVSVVGNFNGWDVKRNPMRKLRTSGVWELFIPRLK